MGTWWQIFNFFLLSPNRWYHFNSRINSIHFAGITTWNNWESITETRSYTFKWHSRCRWLRPCLSSLKFWTSPLCQNEGQLSKHLLRWSTLIVNIISPGSCQSSCFTPQFTFTSININNASFASNGFAENSTHLIIQTGINWPNRN